MMFVRSARIIKKDVAHALYSCPKLHDFWQKGPIMESQQLIKASIIIHRPTGMYFCKKIETQPCSFWQFSHCGIGPIIFGLEKIQGPWSRCLPKQKRNCRSSPYWTWFSSTCGQTTYTLEASRKLTVLGELRWSSVSSRKLRRNWSGN